MEDNSIRRYATLMSELGLTGLEIRENGSELRLERTPAASETAATVVTAVNDTADVQEPCTEITSPMVGVFYRAAAENMDPFVHVGDAVKAGDVLCIIESMKLMNEITSNCDGVIAEICVQNAEVVDYGRTLFKIRKA